MKVSKFRVFNFRATFCSRDFNFANFFKSRKSRKLSLAKISDNKVVASCYGNRDKLRPDGPLGSYADFTYFSFIDFQ